MTTEGNSPSSFKGRPQAPRWRRMWSSNVDDLPVEDRVRQIDEGIAQLGPRLARTGRWSVFALLGMSMFAALVSAFIDLNDVIPNAAIVIAVLTAIPTGLDCWERFRHNTAGGRYHAWTERLTRRLALLVRRRRLSWLFATYGRQEIAVRVLDADAPWYSLAAQARRRRITRIVAAAVIMAGIASLGIRLTVFNSINLRYRLHDEFSLGNLYKLRVNAVPSCKDADESSQRATCKVPITVRNVSPDPQDLGSGSFGVVTSRGPIYYVIDDYQDDFATSLIGPAGYYYYDSGASPLFESVNLQPGRSADDIFVYDVDRGARITELVFTARTDSRTTIHVDFGTKK